MNHPLEIHVIGCYGQRPAPEGVSALERAEIIAGSASLLNQNPFLPESAERVLLGGDLKKTLADLLEHKRDKRTVVLASGDPLYHGIGQTIQRFVSPEHLRFYPSPTAFQQLCARLGVAWDRAGLCSLHAGSALPFRRLARMPLGLVYGDASRPASRLASLLIGVEPSLARRPAAAGCNLGFPDEKIVTGTLSEIADSPDASASLSVLLLLPWNPDDCPRFPEFPLGLPDDSYVHMNHLITHPEVRAVVLSKLRLIPGVMWDFGAGSGSVGLEAAGLCPDLSVCAVEKNEARTAQLEENARREGLPNFLVRPGDALTLADELPPPDRIFIGGGAAGLLKTAFERLNPGGRLVATGVTAETTALLCTELLTYRTELLTLNVSRAESISGGAHLFRAENPILIAVFVKPEKETIQ